MSIFGTDNSFADSMEPFPSLNQMSYEWLSEHDFWEAWNHYRHTCETDTTNMNLLEQAAMEELKGGMPNEDTLSRKSS